MPPSASENGDRGFIAATEALPSWNDGPAKQAIIDFVARCTDETGPGFVPPANRIATFDQDGTQSWPQLSEQFPAEDKWISAGLRSSRGPGWGRGWEGGARPASHPKPGCGNVMRPSRSVTG